MYCASPTDSSRSLEVLGRCRTLLAEKSEQAGLLTRDPADFRFLWVIDFPLFAYEDGQLGSSHHPFTAPQRQDIDRVLQHHGDASGLLDVKGQHYDLVVNGMEIAGGSIRIHDANLQLTVLKVAAV